MLIKTFLGQGEMSFGQIRAIYSLPAWQVVKLTFFAPCEVRCGFDSRCERSPTHNLLNLAQKRLRVRLQPWKESNPQSSLCKVQKIVGSTKATTVTSVSYFVIKTKQKSVTSILLLGEVFVCGSYSRCVQSRETKTEVKERKGERGKRQKTSIQYILLHQLQNEKHATKTACCFSKMNFSK